MNGTPAAAPGADIGLREEMIVACRRMNGENLTGGTSGNVSIRTADGMLITPSGVAYDTMSVADLVALTLGGGQLTASERRPSTEWRMHARIYETRPDVNAIVHTHSVYATALACMRRRIPPFHYMVAAAGGSDVPCTPYATFGTDELAAHAAVALTDRNACLLANHGVLAAGRSVARALALAREIETLAQQYCIALQAGEPVLLTAAEMAAAERGFAGYGDTV